MTHKTVWWIVVALLVSCAPTSAPSSSGTASSGVVSERPAAVKRVAAAIAGDPHTLYQRFNPSSTVRGVEEMELLVNAGFSVEGRGGVLQPVLAEQVPSLENGLWKLLPDGKMETTWRIKENARWHDGAPVVAQDAMFAATVGQDRDLQIIRYRGLSFIDAIETPDARTVTVRWKQPYIEADQAFTPLMAMPLPSHLLEQAYQTDKASFANLPYWTEEFVGARPFKIKEFVRGSHMLLEANGGFVLGRPKLDIIDVRFIVDPTTLVANALAGAVDFTLGRGVSLEQGLQVRDQWREGKAEMAVASFLQLFPQLLTPNPPVIGNVQFRRALLHGIDRQEMVESIQSGVVPMAHAFILPDGAEYRAIESSIVKYAFDSRRAAQMIEELGYTKATDGFYRDAAGQRLTLEIRATQGDLNTKSMLSIADYWQRLGIAVETISIPPQRATDLEYRSNFPGFAVQRQGGELAFMESFHSVQARTAANRFAGSNNTRYMNPELDALIDRYGATIPVADRLQIANQVVRHITEQVVELPLFYDVQPSLIGNRLINVNAARGSSTSAYNAVEWDVRP